VLWSGGTGAGRLEAGRPEAGRPEAGRLDVRFRLSGSNEAGRPAGWDRVVAKAVEADFLGRDDRMPDRAMVMWPRAVAGL
jgi:hypothetical protein